MLKEKTIALCIQTYQHEIFTHKHIFFFDRPSNRAIHPETYHAEPPLCIQSNTIRQYKEHGLTYVYHVGGDHPRDFCRI